MKNTKEIRKSIVVLVVICLLTSAALAVMNHFTAPVSAANAEARAALDKECEQAAAAMTAAAKQHEAEWTAELVRRALAQEAAQ